MVELRNIVTTPKLNAAGQKFKLAMKSHKLALEPIYRNNSQLKLLQKGPGVPLMRAWIYFCHI